jgi:RNA polymerase sigma factor for flagellar operon FliA
VEYVLPEEGVRDTDDLAHGARRMTATERRDWDEFRTTGNVVARNRLVERHLGLVHHFARRMRPRTAGTVDLGDLVSAGAVGLLQAVSAYDPDHGSTFSTFAASRIRGAMLDEMRRRDVAPRSVRRKQRELEQARERLAVTLDRKPRADELAAALGVEPQELWRWEWDVARSRRVSLSELRPSPTPRLSGSAEPGRAMDVEERLSLEAQVERLQDELAELPEREQLVIRLYDLESWTLREIGDQLGVTESRVSQIRSRALARLRDRMLEVPEAA